MEVSPTYLIYEALRCRTFTHPNKDVIQGKYEVVEFNLDGSVLLKDIKTKERIRVGDVIFYGMKTTIPDPRQSKLEQSAQTQPSCTKQSRQSQWVIDENAR